MLTFCTLFDSNYLDKGLTLYESLKNVAADFILYILAMDDRCFTILKDQNLSNAVIIPREEFEDEELLEIKKKRTKAEYCWTCTASLIDYVFERYGEEYCTYIDSDLFFYKNPKILIEEMCNAGCSVQIVEHGFGHDKRALAREKRSGKYCVQFNTFKNDEYGREILSVWKKQCRNHCSMQPGEMGDQKYLSEWPEKYQKVHVLSHPGGGVAPWNIARFKKSDEGKGYLIDKETKQPFELIFYHFHHLEYVDNCHVNINVFKNELKVDQRLVTEIYLPYLRKLEEVKRLLAVQYDFVPIIKQHPGIGVSGKAKKVNLKDLPERIRTKLVYLRGKRKDIINLEKYI